MQSTESRAEGRDRQVGLRGFAMHRVGTRQDGWSDFEGTRVKREDAAWYGSSLDEEVVEGVCQCNCTCGDDAHGGLQPESTLSYEWIQHRQCKRYKNLPML